MPKGYLSFVLHAHLPFVRHPEYDQFLEERWLFEAMTETYIPLIKSWRQLAKENVPFHVTISISPSLLAMLEDPLLQSRYLKHVEQLIELCQKEQQRLKHDPHLAWLAQGYEHWFRETKELFEQYDCRLSKAFKELYDHGSVELMTCAATHGLLPILSAQPKAVEAQVATGLDYFEDVFGFRSKGLWLPECGYYAGVEEVLKRHGVRYFFVENIAVENASVVPHFGVNKPMYTPAGVAAFARDEGITKEVWSAENGYPGDPDYREFYCDIGYDADWDYIHPYLPGDVRCDTGLKYYRVTGPTQWKQPYHFGAAREKAAQHAGQFVFSRVAQVEYLDSIMPSPPIITAPFDAELFGHWWFEGPQWLDFVFRKAAYDQQTFELTTPSRYLEQFPVNQCGTPACSTWGHKGYFQYWLNGKTDWIIPQIRECSARMESLAINHGKGKVAVKTKRALNQCMRELLLAQSSDWPFIISGGTSQEYASRTVKDHVSRFHKLADDLDHNEINDEVLNAIEYIDNPFPNVDYKLYL